MNKNNEEYVLGQDITSIARAKNRKETSVVSVRLTGSEVTKLDSLSRQSMKSVSQIVKDAIAAYEVKQTTVVLATGVEVGLSLAMTTSC